MGDTTLQIAAMQPQDSVDVEALAAAEEQKQRTAEDDYRDMLRDTCIQYILAYKANLELLWAQQAEAMKIYMAEAYGDEVEGRSKFVESLAFDAIEWLKPMLTRVFMGGNDFVKLTPLGPEDEQPVKMLEEKVNQDFRRNFNSFRMCNDWWDDALKLKVGVVKWWWERDTIRKERVYEGLDPMEYQKLKSDPRNLFDKETQNPDGTWDVYTYRLRRVNQPMAMAVPAEEFIFDTQCVSIADSDFCAHRVKWHKSLIMSTFDIKEVDLQNEVTALAADMLTDQRFKDLGGFYRFQDTKEKDYYWVYECYLNDYSTGVKKPLKIMLMGNKLLDYQPHSYRRPNYSLISPILIAHREVGLSYIDALADLQRIATSLSRIILDNCYFQNAPANIIDPSGIDQDDCVNNNVPGGWIKTRNGKRPSDVIFPLTPIPLGAQVFEMRKFIDQIKDNRIGNSQYSRGDDSQAINKTAHGIAQLMDAASKRAELICRIFAETGFRDLAIAFCEMNIDYLDDQTAIRIDQQWQTIKRSDIDVDYDLSVDVGIGTGSKEATVGQLNALFEMIVPLVQNKVVGPEGLVEVVKSVAEAMGQKNAQKFLPPPPAPPPMMIPGGVTPPPQTGQGGAAPEQGASPQGMNAPPLMQPQMPQPGGVM